tara:strand:+ start:9769 stop:10260 length:492 start_codon:yes stop_codon:yes gene_type:complete
MKKLFISLVFFALVIFSVNAQDISRNAIGLRFGDNDGFGSEISYQHELGEATRLELDLGFRNRDKYGEAFKLTGIYQWVWNLDGRFNWYAGFGASIGSWSKGNDYTGNDDDGLFLSADGNIGIEYDFNIPLLISIDFRPEFGVVGDYGDGTDLDLALSLRYQF